MRQVLGVVEQWLDRAGVDVQAREALGVGLQRIGQRVGAGTFLAQGCPVAACISEVRRQGDGIGATFTEGFLTMVELMQRALPSTTLPEEARRRALTLISALVGSVAMARAVETTDPALAREIISAARKELEHVAIR
jgi:hypothetical protein